jgi:hypothetical protein
LNVAKLQIINAKGYARDKKLGQLFPAICEDHSLPIAEPLIGVVKTGMGMALFLQALLPPSLS